MPKKDKKQHQKKPVAKAPELKSKKNSFFENIKSFYIVKYKMLFVMFIVLSVLAIATIFGTYLMTGDFTKRDVSLKGGISLTINRAYQDTKDLENFLSERFPESSLNLRTIESAGVLKGIIIEASDISEEELMAAVQSKIGVLGKNDFSIETMGSSLGESFFRETFIAIFFAFIGMGLVFHFYFRNIYATGAALLSAFLDIVITLAVMNLIGMRLTAGGIAAYLMLIGYSIDTSILLSTKLLKDRTNEVSKSLFKAMKTGLTMSAAGIAATGISFLLTNNATLKQIMLILIVGLVLDIITTWIGNASLLRIYLEKKNVKA